MNRFLLTAFLAAITLLPIACSKPAGTVVNDTTGKPRVAVVTNCTAEFWNICEAGANKAAAEFGVELVFKQPENNTVSDQNRIIDTLTKTNVKGLAVSVINPTEQTPDLKRIGKNVKLITMDNDAADSGRMCYVGINNYDAGKAVGRMVKQALPDGGTLAIFIGTTTSTNAKDRVAGVLDELAGSDNRKAIANGIYEEKYGKFTLFRKAPIEDDTTENKALDNSNNVLEQVKEMPNVCMVGLYAYNPKAILEAARSKKLVNKIKIVGFDEDTVTLDGITKGEIIGTVVQDPFNYGYESVRLLSILVKGGDQSQLPTKPTPYRIVTKDGGADQTVDGQAIKNIKADDYMKKLKADSDSVKKK
jgi:ribose transport system substrate-binding protein